MIREYGAKLDEIALTPRDLINRLPSNATTLPDSCVDRTHLWVSFWRVYPKGR